MSKAFSWKELVLLALTMDFSLTQLRLLSSSGSLQMSYSVLSLLLRTSIYLVTSMNLFALRVIL